MSTTTKKNPTPTFAITKKEWQDVFKDTITVKRQKELFEKINRRLNFISDFFGDGGEFYVSNLDDIECYEDSDMIDIENCTISIDDSTIFGYENVPVFWLWDDSWIKKIEDFRAKEKIENKENEYNRVTNLVSALRNSLSPEQIDLFRMYGGTIINLI